MFLDINPLPRPRSPQPQAHWKPPQTDAMKINFEGANFSELKKSGIGVVVRDSAGQVLASMSQKINQAYSAEQIETLDACKALQFASDIGFRVAVLEGDSQILMKRLADNLEVLSYSGVLLKDVRCSRFFNHLHYSHVKKKKKVKKLLTVLLGMLSRPKWVFTHKILTIQLVGMVLKVNAKLATRASKTRFWASKSSL